MQQVADLVVQERLADWCVVELPGDERTSDQMAVAHRDPEMVARPTGRGVSTRRSGATTAASAR